jgi:hypothetical protein
VNGSAATQPITAHEQQLAQLADACNIRTRGFFTISVLAHLDRGFEVLRMKKDGVDSEHGTEIRSRQQVLVIAIGSCTLRNRNFGFSMVDLFVVDVTERRDAYAGVIGE